MRILLSKRQPTSSKPNLIHHNGTRLPCLRCGSLRDMVTLVTRMCNILFQLIRPMVQNCLCRTERLVADYKKVPFIDNQTGSYVVKFSVPDSFSKDQLRLRFEGVDSSFHVWLNGKQIGYSQGARNPSEFDITDHVKEGENTLAVRVYQWSDGSYIEDQGALSLSSSNLKKLIHSCFKQTSGSFQEYSEMSFS